MNKMRKIFCVSLILTMLLAGCKKSSGETEAEADTQFEWKTDEPQDNKTPEPEVEVMEVIDNVIGTDGKYTFLGILTGPYYILDDRFASYTIELKKDGTGRIDFGEENHEITSWTREDAELTIRTDSTVNKADWDDGLLYFHIRKGTDYPDLVLAFAKEGRDCSGYAVKNMDELTEVIVEELNEVPAGEIYGYYTVYALESKGARLLFPEEDKKNALEFALYYYDYGLVRIGGKTELIFWRQDGDTLNIIDRDGTSELGDMIVKLEGGFITAASGNDPEAEGYYKYYFAKNGTDVSGLSVMTVEEYRQSLQKQ